LVGTSVESWDSETVASTVGHLVETSVT